jgi:hypothetical protein
MIIDLNCRQFVKTTLALAATGGASRLVASAINSAAASAPTSLVVDRRTIDVKGKAATVFGLRQQDGTWGLRQGAMRDTVLVPQGGSVTVAFDANNPGRWLLHCDNLFHMARGMMTEIAYDRAPSL